ncbi:MAG: hypothetical protein LBD06_01925, partial [Candidatus Accumulibacter sp.]|nr:hypothetical protein [Accumulibacter sp.]
AVAPYMMENPIARFFLPHPARQRRKLICLLSAIVCPLKLSSVRYRLSSETVFCPLSSVL